MLGMVPSPGGDTSLLPAMVFGAGAAEAAQAMPPAQVLLYRGRGMLVGSASCCVPLVPAGSLPCATASRLFAQGQPH